MKAGADWDRLDDAALVGAANAALRAGDLDALIGALEALLRRHRDNDALRQRLAAAFNRRGALAAREGRLRAAEADVDRALALAPDLVDALFNRARFLASSRHWKRALADYRRLLALRPEDPEIVLDAAEAAALAGEPEGIARLAAAVAATAGAAAIDPIRRASALATLGESDAAVAALERAELAATPRLAAEPGDRLREGPDWRQARRAFALAAAAGAQGRRAPSLRSAIASRLALPMVYRSADDLAAARASYLEGLAGLATTFDAAALAPMEPALEQLAWTNQMLAYQGQDDRAPAAAYGRWLAGAAARFAPTFAEAPTYRPGRQLRVGLVSAGFYRSVLGNYFGSWIGGLADAGFEVSVFLVDTPVDDDTRRMTARARTTHALSGTIESMAAQLREARLDVLIHPDVGIDARCQVLAALRLAPRQLAGWGHPETTGLPTLDGFLSCAAMEPDDAQRHYAERLLLLPGAGTAFVDPGDPPRLSRADFGLPEDAHLYLVPHVPPKLHPDCDAVFARIAAADPRALLLTFRFDRPAVRTALAGRLTAALESAGADPGRQWRELPYLPRERFLGLCALSDVMIDTLHWSGGANTVDALRCGLPVVTCPGALMRGRQTLGMLHMLGLEPALSVDTPAALAERAVAVAADHDARARLGTTIRAAMPVLFDGRDALAALAERVRATVEN
jgi:tetratricopeptide (TPR) repeat protein